MLCLFFTADDKVLTCSVSLFNTLIFTIFIGYENSVGLFFKPKSLLKGCEDGAINLQRGRNAVICLSDTCSTPADVPEGLMPVRFCVVFIFPCVVLHYNINILLMWIMKE